MFLHMSASLSNFCKSAASATCSLQSFTALSATLMSTILSMSQSRCFTFRTAECRFNFCIASRSSLSTAILKSGLAYFPRSSFTVSSRERNASSSTLCTQSREG